MNYEYKRNRIYFKNVDEDTFKKLTKIFGATYAKKDIISFPINPLTYRQLDTFFDFGDALIPLREMTSERINKVLRVKGTHGERCGHRLLSQIQVDFLHFAKAAKSGILSDDRGLGKTLSLISLAELLQWQKVLIVVPGYLKKNWAREFLKWYGIKVKPCEGERNIRQRIINQSERYTLVNYEMLRLAKSRGGYPCLHEQEWDAVIFDEGHRLKNPQSQIVKGAKKIKANHVWLATGNPIGDAPQDVWQLLNIIDPHAFVSKWGFIEYFCEVEDGFFSKEIKGLKQNKIKELQWLMQLYSIRRLKEGLPEKRHIEIPVKLDGAQAKAYKLLKKNMVVQRKDEDTLVVESAVEAIIRGQQIVANPAILGGEDYSVVENTILELIQDIGNQRVIVGLNYIKATTLLAEKLKKAKIPVYVITGASRDRDAICQEFKKQKRAVLVGSIAAMSEGLSIDECDYMIFGDKSWQPHVNEQFEDRIHRMNSTRLKTYYHIIAQNTVATRKEQVLKEKQNLLSSILDDKELVKDLYKNL
jgi:SNF2 family DNA or RNA helicase